MAILVKNYKNRPAAGALAPAPIVSVGWGLRHQAPPYVLRVAAIAQ